MEPLPRLRTRRLWLAPIGLDDITPEYRAWLRDPDVNRYLEVRFAPPDAQELRAFIAARLADTHSAKHFGVFDEGGRRLVGTVTAPKIEWRHRWAEVSFVIGHRAAQGRGYATEAVHGLVHHLFRDCGLVKLIAGYYDGHAGSARVLAKNGFVEEGRLRRKLVTVEGARVDHVLTGLLAEDFRPQPELLGSGRE